MEQNSCRCPDCFQETMVRGVCGKCGFESEKEKQNPIRLPAFTRLANRYMIGRLLGAGGFGITYKAYDLAENRFCAIKEYAPIGMVTRSNQATELYITAEDWRKNFSHGKKRFVEEAEVLSHMNGMANVVKITDFLSENNTAYFAMEYLEGVTLSQLMGSYGGRIPLQDALPMICAIANTLEVVHTKYRIFHRDISPDNIMITKGGQIKLLDFGNAKYLVGKDSQTFSVVLKHGYAPPEQYSSKSLQGSFTDVYALAATFYYVVSGVRMKVAPDRLTGEEYPRLKDMNIGINAQVSDAVDRALVLNSKKRTQTMGEFVRSLQAGMGNSPVKDSWDVPPKAVVPYVRLVNGTNDSIWRMPPNVTMGIGRSSKVSEIVPSGNAWISKRHCEIFYDSGEDEFYVMDQSTNGTFLNGQPMEKNKIYKAECGDRIELGRNVCVLETGVMK